MSTHCAHFIREALGQPVITIAGNRFPELSLNFMLRYSIAALPMPMPCRCRLAEKRCSKRSGFRRRHSAIDNLLIRRTLVDQSRATSDSLYVCFVDFTKAYDTIPRHLLLHKLRCLDLGEWLMRAISSVYHRVPLAMQNGTGEAAVFESVMEVKRGCPLSPLLFGLHIILKQQSLAPQESCCHTSTMWTFLHYCMLTIWQLMPSTSSGLTVQLETLTRYTERWGLSIHIKKPR